MFGPGNHGTTFGGNPLAMRAALETLSVIEDDGLLANAEHVGQTLRSIFARELSSVAGVVEVRGRGPDARHRARVSVRRHPEARAAYSHDYGLLINVTQERVIRLLPSLVMTADEATLLGEGVVAIVRDFLARQAEPKAA